MKAKRDFEITLELLINRRQGLQTLSGFSKTLLYTHPPTEFATAVGVIEDFILSSTSERFATAVEVGLNPFGQF